VKTNKNDYIDAEAIAEAVGRPSMRFVPIKTDDQLAAFSHTHQFYGVFESRTMGHKSFLGERGHLQAVEA
jgi:hypothetical protein